MALKTLTAEQKQALTMLRGSLGGVSDEKRQAKRHLLEARRGILKLLEAQPATVPQIAKSLHMPTDEVLWHITGMRKYGKVVEAGEEGDYLLYAQVAPEENTASGH